jgi:hypothetical protein
VVNICCFSCNHQPTNQQQAVAIGSQEVGVESQGGVTDGPAALHAERAALVQTPIVAEAPVAHPHTERYDVMISIMTHSPLHLWNGGKRFRSNSFRRGWLLTNLISVTPLFGRLRSNESN